jgi:hypothetical protein
MSLADSAATNCEASWSRRSREGSNLGVPSAIRLRARVKIWRQLVALLSTTGAMSS